MNKSFLTPLRLALLAALAPAPALACPTLADAEGPGVTLSFADGLEMTLQRRGGGVVEQRIADPYEAGVIHVSEYIDGIFYLGGFRIFDGDQRADPVSARFSSPVPDIAAGDSYTILHYVSTEGVETEAEVGVRVGAPTRVEIGGCGYEAMPVALTQIVEGNPYESRALYLPKLGLGYFVGADVFDGDPEVYLAVRIAALGG